jgi:hypothetical protein
MPLYMDLHYVEGATKSGVTQAHDKDLAIQEKYPVKFLTYWFDEPRCTGFCLIESQIRKRSRKPMMRHTGWFPMKSLRWIPELWRHFWAGSRILRRWISQERFLLTALSAPSCSRT